MNRADAGTPPDAVVLLQLGGPERLEDVEPFLRSLLGDPDVVRFPWPMRPLQPAFARAVSRRRAPHVRPRYEAIGGGEGRASPIGELTRRQQRALEARIGIPVHVAMRHSRPSSDDAVATLKEAGSQNVLLLPLYPQRSDTTVGGALRDFARAARMGGLRADLRAVDGWGAHPRYIEAVARTVEEAADGVEDLVFSAHSLPESYIRRGDPYRQDVERSAELLQERLGRRVHLGFQSSMGPGRWLRPETEEHLERLAKEGRSEVALAPLGFVTDHIETLYDLDVKYKEQADALGLRLRRVPSLNDRPDFIGCLAALCETPAPALEATPWTR